MKKIIILFFILYSISTIQAVEPSEYACFINGIVIEIDNVLSEKLGDGYYVKNEDVATLSEIFVREHFTSDIVISKNEWQEMDYAYIFIFPWSAKNLERLMPFAIENISLKFNSIELYIGLICDDQELEEKIINILSSIDYSTVEPWKY